MEMVTRYAGQAHISAEDWAELNRGIAGAESYAFPGGMEFEADLVSNNLLKIYDGCGVMQGRQVRIPAGQSEEVTIENGTQGEKRIDLVVERYTKNEDTKVEKSETILIKGTPSENDPQVPAHVEGDIRAGDIIADWPLYEVELDGINVVEVRPVFKMLMDMSTLNAYLAELESKTPEESSNYIKFADGTLIQWGNVSSPGSNNGYGNISFPEAFANLNYYLSATPKYFNPSYPVFLVSAQRNGNNKAIVYFRQAYTNAIITGVSADWIAIGKWK